MNLYKILHRPDSRSLIKTAEGLQYTCPFPRYHIDLVDIKYATAQATLQGPDKHWQQSVKSSGSGTALKIVFWWGQKEWEEYYGMSYDHHIIRCELLQEFV